MYYTHTLGICIHIQYIYTRRSLCLSLFSPKSLSSLLSFLSLSTLFHLDNRYRLQRCLSLSLSLGFFLTAKIAKKRKKKTSDFSSGKYVCMYVNQIFVAVGREGEGRMMMMTPAKEWVVVIIDIPYECGMYGKWVEARVGPATMSLHYDLNNLCIWCGYVSINPFIQ